MIQGPFPNIARLNFHEKDGESIAEFCASLGISRSMYYKLMKNGAGPRVLRLGSRRIITKTAKAEFLKAHT